MYVAVYNIRVNYNPGSYYIVADVISSSGTQSGIEVFADDTATTDAIKTELAEAARSICRQNNEDIETDQPVTIFGDVVQVI